MWQKKNFATNINFFVAKQKKFVTFVTVSVTNTSPVIASFGTQISSSKLHLAYKLICPQMNKKCEEHIPKLDT